MTAAQTWMLAWEQCDNARSSAVWKALISSWGTEVGSGLKRQAANVALRISTLIAIVVGLTMLRSHDVSREFQADRLQCIQAWSLSKLLSHVTIPDHFLVDLNPPLVDNSYVTILVRPIIASTVVQLPRDSATALLKIQAGGCRSSFFSGADGRLSMPPVHNTLIGY